MDEKNKDAFRQLAQDAILKDDLINIHWEMERLENLLYQDKRFIELYDIYCQIAEDNGLPKPTKKQVLDHTFEVNRRKSRE